MKRRWIPAALIGALAIGYLVGQDQGEPPPPVPPPVAPPPVVIPVPVAPVQPLPIAPDPYPVPVLPAQPAPIEPPADPIPEQLAGDDGLAPYPAWKGVDLNCPDVGRPVRVIDGYDPHGLDRDGDGIGCDG